MYGTLINEQYSWLPMIAATNGYVLFPKAIIKYYDMQLWYLLWRVRMLKDHEKNYLLANERFFKNENVTLEGFFVFEKTDEYVTFEKYLLKEVKIEKLLFQDKNAWETLRKGSSSMQLPITNVLHKLVDCINDQRQIRRDKNNFLATKNVTEFTKNIIAGREATFLRKWGFASWQ
ncbi:MAG: hypothetical protein KA052_03075 [Candidatus Pacebacteria bacterium]|nr:hypothetical protein [Candidatus Paceibacterota bacterium]